MDAPLEADGLGLIVHPCSKTFAPDVRTAWREAFRVPRPPPPGFSKSIAFLFDKASLGRGELRVERAIPNPTWPA